MRSLTYQKVACHLEKMKIIYETLQLPKKDVKEIENAIEIFNRHGDIPIEEKGIKTRPEKRSNNKTKPTFSEIVDSLFNKNYSVLAGTKLNYAEFRSVEKIIHYMDNTSKTKVMKDAAAIDLKLLYCLLTEDKQELKGTKNEIYEAIKRDIRTKKRGKAFLEFA
ncbi:hypothetical protein [Bacillus sp. REN16]|uniref:hypothetical protein n=1 Tax=Bacillus sp. REN16 TaxID=2887296 RepID=UPI001E4CBF03|nr:hypothetical protein [Bacillus sp. REN16]MCC3358582.1 hypothetical protein [Bacillus sp. REN16]